MGQSYTLAIDELTATETDSLVWHEQTIQHGLQTFYEVGNALAVIRDSRLYRYEYATFEEYCDLRWGLKQAYAYRLMDAAGVVNTLKSSPIGELLPANESQTRPLTSLPTPELQREAWQRAVETAPDNKPTAAHVARVAEAFKVPQPPARAAEPAPHAVHFSSTSNEWYTPARILDRARQVLGTIDLDPASSTAANKDVQATRFYTQDDNGLAQPWRGNVYMNPPYGDEIIQWVERLCTAYTSMEVESAIALLPARTDTKWFALLRDFALCFVRGRLKFSGSDQGAPFPSVVVYLGDDYDKFIKAFGDIGDIYMRLDRQE